MSKPKITIHDLATGEIIEREMNDAELEVWQADQKAIADAQAEKAAKEAAKSALLEKLGISEDEAELLLA